MSYERYLKEKPEAKWIEHTLKHFGELNNLHFGTDIQALTIGSTSRYNDYFLYNKNKTSYAIAFCTTYWDTEYVNLPCALEYPGDGEPPKDFYFYSLMYNTTLVTESLIENKTETMMNDVNLLRIKQGIDEGIISYQNAKLGKYAETPAINISASHYPAPIDRFIQGMNITAFMGAYWFNLPCLVTFLVTVILLIEEKEFKLRQGLNVIGVSHALYWSHWVITFMALSFLATLIQIVSGIIFGLEFFYNTNLVILVAFFLMYHVSMSLLGFLMVTMVPTRTVAYGI